MAISSIILRLVFPNHRLCLKKSACPYTWAITSFWSVTEFDSCRYA